MSGSHLAGLRATMLVLLLVGPLAAQNSDVVLQVKKLLSRDPAAAVSAAQECLVGTPLDRAERAQLIHLLGRGLTMTQDFQGALSKLAEARQLAQEVGDEKLLVRIRQAEAVAYCEDGDYQRGAAAARAGIRLADATENKLLLGILHAELGANLCGLSNYEGAIAAFNSALDTARELNKPKLSALALGNLASIYDELGNFERAAELHRAALEFFRASKNKFLIATTQVNLANSLLHQGLLDQAGPLFKDTVELAKEINLLNVLALAYVGCGDVALERSDIEQAKRDYALAGECLNKAGDPTGRLMLIERSVKIAKLESPLSSVGPEATAELKQAFSLALSLGNKKQAIAIAELLIVEYELQQQWQQAMELTQKVGELKQEIWSHENKVLLSETETRVLVLQKEQEIRELNHTNQLQQLELQNQRRTRLLYIVALGLALAVIGIAWRLLSVRRKAYLSLQRAHAERRCQEQRQIELERKLADENKTESLRIMAGGIAHDFNNLLSGIIGEAEYGQLQSDTNDKDSHFDQIINVAGQASGLTNQLISFSGHSANRARPMELGKVIQSSSGVLKSIANTGTEVELQLTDDELPVIGDETQIRQVLVNLVKNASEAIEQAGEISISTGQKLLTTSELSPMPLGCEDREGEYCFLQVQDNGSGLEPQLLSRIFDPFFSTKFVGRGLGLASVLGIVRSHRGAISVESRVDLGTTITVFLPRATPAEIEKVVDVSTRMQAVQEAVDNSFGVMFVDDDPIVRQSAANILRAFGYQVYAAASAEEALDIVAKERDQIRVAVIDFAMTGANGIWLAEQLSKRAPEIIRILCSGYTEEVKSSTELFAAFLPKPYVAMDLIELVQRRFVTGEQTPSGAPQGRQLEIDAIET